MTNSRIQPITFPTAVGGLAAAFLAGWLAMQSAFTKWDGATKISQILSVETSRSQTVPFEKIVEEDRRFLYDLKLNGPASSAGGTSPLQ